jgi:hypothetical protein
VRKLVFGLVLVSVLTASAATLQSSGSRGFLSAMIGWLFGTPNTRCGWGDGTNNNCN